jgi:hypothetical protein
MYNVQELEEMLKKDGILFLTYGGYFTQSLIVAMTEALEKEAQNAYLSVSLANNIFVVFIELSQNLMNYSKNIKSLFDPKGLITVGKNEKEGYYVFSQNIVTKEDKEKIEKILKLITSITRDEIRKIYRERRRGAFAHEKGGGIGFFEIAKRAKKIEYLFEKIDDERDFFKFKAILGE